MTAEIRLEVRLRICAMLLCLIITLAGGSGGATDSKFDFVDFFKQAIASPPDVERYVASQRQLESATPSVGPTIKSGLVSYYVGARAGSNYFLQIYSGSNGIPDLTDKQLIAGRSGAVKYEVNQNAVSFGAGSNALTANIGSFYTMTRQFLGMGISEIEPESVRWVGNAFTATNNHGIAIYGELNISNGLPYRLEVSLAKATPPYKVVEYTYPNPPPSLSGFPSRLIISRAPHGIAKPFCEVSFFLVQLARRPLADDFFAAPQFIGTNIIFTNTYSEVK